jgi:rubrerythrin
MIKIKKIRCLVCGMIINDNNYDLNRLTLLEENTSDQIIRCPFCGVTHEYLGEGYVDYDIKNLDEKTKKILDMGMKLEIFNSEFYLEASMQTKDESLKKLFKELSAIEMMHARIHKNFGGFNKLPQLKEIDYSRHNTDELLLIEAHKREKHAIQFYERYYNEVPIKYQNIFKALSFVEKEHYIITDN